MPNITIYDYLQNPLFYASGRALYTLLRLFQFVNTRGEVVLNDDFYFEYEEEMGEVIDEEALKELIEIDVLLEVEGRHYVLNSNVIWNNPTTRAHNQTFVEARATYSSLTDPEKIKNLIEDRRIGFCKSRSILLRNFKYGFLDYEASIRYLKQMQRKEKELFKKYGIDKLPYRRQERNLFARKKYQEIYKLINSK